MVYKIVIEPGAGDEIDAAFEYYISVTNSLKTSLRLLEEIEKAILVLKSNPYFQIRSKHFRAIPIKKFPYLLFFEILEETKVVKIVALFNTPQDSKKWV